jgi:hypothetical protein
MQHMATERSVKLSAAAQKRWKHPGEVEAQSIRMQQVWDRPGFRERHKAALTARNGGDTIKGRIWITNGVERQRIDPSAKLPEGWRKGKENTAAKPVRIAMKGSVWITDGEDNRRIAAGVAVPDGWKKGRS